MSNCTKEVTPSSKKKKMTETESVLETPRTKASVVPARKTAVLSSDPAKDLARRSKAARCSDERTNRHEDLLAGAKRGGGGIQGEMTVLRQIPVSPRDRGPIEPHRTIIGKKESRISQGGGGKLRMAGRGTKSTSKGSHPRKATARWGGTGREKPGDQSSGEEHQLRVHGGEEPQKMAVSGHLAQEKRSVRRDGETDRPIASGDAVKKKAFRGREKIRSWNLETVCQILRH